MFQSCQYFSAKPATSSNPLGALRCAMLRLLQRFMKAGVKLPGRIGSCLQSGMSRGDLEIWEIDVPLTFH